MSPTSSRRASFVAAILLLTASLVSLTTAAPPVPTQLTDEQFWQLSSSMSETDGEFRSDNLLSNELNFQYVIPELVRVAQPGRVYMGVGPEQNFSYIAALKPSMAFIVDIRHGNLDVHLLYKALFEMSETRSEFISKLFSRKQPADLSTTASATQLFAAYRQQERDKDLFESNLKAVIDHLKTKHKFPLSAGDEDGIKWALSNYFSFGPDIYYNASDASFAPAIVGANAASGRRGGGGSSVTYADLMTADDGTGTERSYLANEENFKVLKNLQTKNLLVPVVGDFGGPKALREVGNYLKSVGGMVSAFYLSNVEQYLENDGKTSAFLSSVATLPIDDTSRFISTGGGGNRGFGGGGGSMNNSRLRNMFVETRPYVK
ncbi:MAG TPA: hypothetical protein VMT78_10320 [Terriglobia bacterium]|nr:hypothetical protein [Terriglobia bacterium]